MVLLLTASLFLARPAPLDMPRATAFLVKENGSMRLEDRYDVLDLWTSQTVLGRWEDDDGRVFSLSRLDVVPPLVSDSVKTRAAYAATKVMPEKKETKVRDLSISMLSPCEVTDEPRRPHVGVRGMKEVLYFQGTNTANIVCSFLPEESDAWYLATWELVEGDDQEFSTERFEEDFLAKWGELVKSDVKSELAPRPKSKKKPGKIPPERELLRADARHSVVNYATWHATDGDEFCVLDNLEGLRDFVASVTNDLKTMRAKYAEVVPSPIDGSNVLCVARIYRDRNEYLDAVGEDMKWSAAYWSPQRRELVAHLPDGGAAELLKTIRHEAFHQYLSYACSMISASPWFNEGYAQYFENAESDDWGMKDVVLDFEALAAMLPSVMAMDYETFYAGTDLERRLKYRIAWSIAYFIENGAPKVRFQPFKNLKRDYVAALIKTQRMSAATAAAFGSEEKLSEFVAEWKKFWLAR